MTLDSRSSVLGCSPSAHSSPLFCDVSYFSFEFFSHVWGSCLTYFSCSCSLSDCPTHCVASYFCSYNYHRQKHKYPLDYKPILARSYPASACSVGSCSSTPLLVYSLLDKPLWFHISYHLCARLLRFSFYNTVPGIPNRTRTRRHWRVLSDFRHWMRPWTSLPLPHVCCLLLTNGSTRFSFDIMAKWSDWRLR